MKSPVKNKISVIIPAYNREACIADTLQSVLNQSLTPDEIIVVDDGSTDRTKEIVDGFGNKIRYFYQKNSGVASARNKGLSVATGDLISFVDADDLWMKNKTALQYEILKSNPTIKLVIGFLLVVPLQSNDQQLPVDPEKEKGVFALSLGSALIRKSVFDNIGGFDEEMLIAEDTDWFMRMREAGIKFYIQKEIVQLYRTHEQSITRNKKRVNSYLLKALKKSIDRRRKAGNNAGVDFAKPENIDEVNIHWLSKTYYNEK